MPTLTSVTKHFITAQEGFTTTTAGSVASGAATVTLNSVSGYTNGDQVAFVIDPTDVTKKQVFTGTIDTSGVQVTNVVWTEGTNQTHAAGATVVDYTTATHQAAMVKGVKVSLDQDGTLKAGAVDNAAALASDVVTTAKIADDAVTPAKRSGGFYIGTISGTTLGTTGNKAITGVGFAPKLVRFYVMPSASAGSTVMGHGAMTSSAQHTESASSTSTFASRYSSTSACVSWLTAGSSTPTLLASYVSMDADGFTINVDTASGTFDVVYEAFA